MSQQINLFNPIFLKKKRYFSAVTMVQALGLIVVGSTLLTVYTAYRISVLEKEAEATSAQLAALRTKSDKINGQYAPKQKSKQLEDEILKTDIELRPLPQVLSILQKGDFGNTSGYAEYMRAFSRQIVDGIWLSGFRIDGAGSDISIQGHALNPELVPIYITRLKREPALQGKSFAALEMQTQQTIQPAKMESAVVRQKAAIAYIDFNLQSSGMIKEPQADKAAKIEPRITPEAYLETMRALAAADAAGVKKK
jgi:hypothetical protein